MVQFQSNLHLILILFLCDKSFTKYINFVLYNIIIIKYHMAQLNN